MWQFIPPAFEKNENMYKDSGVYVEFEKIDQYQRVT